MKACATFWRHLAAAASALSVLAGVLASVAFAPSSALQARQPAGAAPITAVTHIGIVVSDLDRSLRFYTEVLPFEKMSETEVHGARLERTTGVFGSRCRSARLRLGQEEIELTQFLAPEGRPIPIDTRSHDRWFQHIAIVVSDMDRAYQHLRRFGVRHASSGPQRLPDWNPNAGGISAFYFKDPDGHALEIIHFPRGKGDAKWQVPDERLFLGIDHTAIVVADTERALSFYRDVLGLRIVGGSENYGTEQEHLNNVFGARLRITALRASRGPGVELLEYLAPTDGREAPGDSRANDLIAWTTHMAAEEGMRLESWLSTHRVRWVSPGVVGEGNAREAVSAVATLRDPDGHLVVLSGAN